MSIDARGFSRQEIRKRIIYLNRYIVKNHDNKQALHAALEEKEQLEEALKYVD